MGPDPPPGVVRVLDGTGATAGTGFLVSTNLVATCAHVVELAAAGPSAAVRVAFLGGAERAADVDADSWRASDAEDIAILRLRAPVETAPLPLGLSAGLDSGTYRTFGFPAAKPVEGLAGELRLIGATTENRARVLQIRSKEVSLGFSGAPAWDVRTGAVIGMVVSVIQAGVDPAGRQDETSFLTPVEALRLVCPELALAGECPYRGIEVFHEQHADVYFGREAAAEELLRLISVSPLVVVVGVSGSGKSSLVRAGLAKALAARPVAGLASRRRVAFRPGPKPLLALDQALGGRRLMPDREPETVAAELCEAAGPEGLILIADQLERVYAQCEPAVRERFLRTLLAAAGDRVKIVVTLRADFYGEALETGLADALEHARLTLLPMTTAELRAAIEEPARVRLRSFEHGLVDRIAGDVSDRGGDLPLLEFALTELWERDSAGGVLTFASYDSLSYVLADGTRLPGAQGAVARRADEVWSTLGAEERKAAQRVLLELVDASQLAPHAAVVATRAFVDEWDERTRHVADRLAEERLLTKGYDAGTREPVVEVAHEALIRAWPPIGTWLRDQAAFLQWSSRQLRPFLQQWREHGHAAGYLLPAPMVAEAARWLERNPEGLAGEPQRYIVASIDGAARRQRRRTALFLFACALALGAALAAGYAFVERSHADQQERVATLRSVAFQARGLLDNGPDLAALLSATSYARRDDPAVRGSLFSVVQSLDPLALVKRGVPGAVALSPDGKVLAVGAKGGILLVDARTGKGLGPRLRTGPIALGSRIRFSGDGRVLLTAGDDGSLALWDIADLRRPRRLVPPPWKLEPRIGDLAIDRTGTLIAATVSGAPGALRGALLGAQTEVWNRRTGRAWRLEPAPVVDALGFARDGSLLVVGDGDVTRWDPLRARRVGRSYRLGDCCDRAVLDWDGRWLATEDFDGIVALWRFGARGLSKRELPSTRAGGYGIAVTPGGERVALGDTDGTITVYEVDGSGVATRILKGHRGSVYVLATDRAGDLASVDNRGGAMLWRLAEPLAGRSVPASAFPESTGDVRYKEFARRLRESGAFVLGKDKFSYLALSDDGSDFVVQADEGIVFGEAEGMTRRWTARQRPGGQLDFATFSPTEHVVAVVESIGYGSELRTTVRYLDTRTGKPRHPGLLFKDLENDAVFAPDGKTLIVALADGDVTAWDVRSGRETWPRRQAHEDYPVAAISPDGETLATGGREGTVRFWSMRDGAEIGDPLTAGDPVDALAFSSDGRKLLGMTESERKDSRRTLQWSEPLWRIGPAMAHLCTLAGRSLTSGEWSRYLSGEPRTPDACGRR